MNRDDILALRKQLIANGYTPVPNIGKACYLTGWPTVVPDEETLRQWGRKHSRFQDTGLRVENGLAVLDLDIDHEVADVIADILEEEEPRLARALLRFGKGHKRAWFLRTETPFARIASRRWLAPDADLDRDGTVCVEAFGGAAARQFGAFGAHTREPDGSVAIAYSWQPGYSDDGSPYEVKLADLPEVDKAVFFRLIDRVEELLQQAGFTPIARTVKGEQVASRVADLSYDMKFECNDHVTRTLEELKAAAGEPGLRCSASWLEPGAGHSLTRCIVGVSHAGSLTLWDAAYGVTHLPVDAPEAERLQRRQDRSELMARIAEKQAQLKSQRQTRPNSEDDAAQVASKLLASYAWCPTRQLQVVPFWSTSTEAGMTLTNFRTTMLPYAEEEIGPRGGVKKINPADIWVSSPQRVMVAGLQLRPDQPRPIFEEHGSKWVNTYDPEVHTEEAAAQGDVSGGLDLLAQLLPDLGERQWFSQWLAHKYRFPAVPGPAVVMVARQHGTGRGTLGELVKALFGPRYVKTIGFDHFAGRTYQSQYTEWQADSLVTIVNESSTADSGSTYRTKHDTYERLKEIVDPRAQQRQIVAKGLKAYPALVCASYLIFTNNPDALPLPADDRRFWVGRNGSKADPEFWVRINAWMAEPANIAAFAAWLADLDLADFDPYAEPPMTEAKIAMTEMARSDIDRAFERAVQALPSELILPEQVLAYMRAIRDEDSLVFPDRWEEVARKLVSRQLVRVGLKDGPGWVLKHDGKRYAVYARDTRAATRWRVGAGGEDFRREALRGGAPGASVATLGAKLQTIVDNTRKG